MIRLTNLNFWFGLVLLPRLLNLAPRTRSDHHKIELSSPGSLGGHWKRVARIAYGRGAEKLGTSPGGEGLVWGPGYGSQTPDGTWWIADAAKRRIAHYDRAGRYLGQYPVPKKFLHLGYFQWQNPIALDNGSVALTGTTIDSPALLVMSPTGHFSRIRLKRFVNIRISDGAHLYGFDEEGKRVKVDPVTGRISTATWFSGQKRHKFRISANKTFLTVERPGVSLKLNLASAEYPSHTVQPTVEAAVGRDGKLWILIDGVVELPGFETAPAAGLFYVTRTGRVSPTLSVRSLTSASDPGDGLHLGIRTGTKTPWLMFVDPDALRIFRKR